MARDAPCLEVAGAIGTVPIQPLLIKTLSLVSGRNRPATDFSFITVQICKRSIDNKNKKIKELYR